MLINRRASRLAPATSGGILPFVRLWTLHPRHLDAQGLVALWREALLAKAVLQGKTRGYRHHPQLRRFQEHPRPIASINAYLHGLVAEARRRGYRFDASKARGPRVAGRMAATTGQLQFEMRHLLRKLNRRSRADYLRLLRVRPGAHPLFRIRPGPVAEWEARHSRS